MDFSKLKYISTEAPTTDELELLNESRVRIVQIIRARWIILGILAAYGVVPYVIFQSLFHRPQFGHHPAVRLPGPRLVRDGDL